MAVYAGGSDTVGGRSDDSRRRRRQLEIDDSLSTHASDVDENADADLHTSMSSRNDSAAVTIVKTNTSGQDVISDSNKEYEPGGTSLQPQTSFDFGFGGSNPEPPEVAASIHRSDSDLPSPPEPVLSWPLRPVMRSDVRQQHGWTNNATPRAFELHKVGWAYR